MIVDEADMMFNVSMHDIRPRHRLPYSPGRGNLF